MALLRKRASNDGISSEMVLVRKRTRNDSKQESLQDSGVRHQSCRTTAVLTSSHSSSSGTCFFHRVPAEVFHMILDKMSVLEISMFSMVSKEIAGYIVEYISTQAWKNKSIIRRVHQSTCLEQISTIGHYRDLGLLFKRCTLLLPTKERLKFSFRRFSQIPCFMLGQCAAPDCNGFTNYGVFLQALIAGWEELECHRVFSFLCNLTNLLQKTEAVITAKPGLKRYQELQLRLFCRRVLLDLCSNQLERQFWLKQLLRPWPLVSQAHLLFIFYGPLLPEGILGWEDMGESRLPPSALWELAEAILILFSKPEVKGWTIDSMLTIFEELIVVPQPWHAENVARLLVMCGSGLCYTILASKALNGQFSEISRLIVHIILVCEKDGYHMKWAVKLVKDICKVFNTPPKKYLFIQQLELMFSEVIREFVALSVAGNPFEQSETFQTLCNLVNSSARFHTHFLQMFLKS